MEKIIPTTGLEPVTHGLQIILNFLLLVSLFYNICDVLLGGVRHLTLHVEHRLLLCPPDIGSYSNYSSKNKTNHISFNLLF